MADNGRLTARQERAAVLLAGGATIRRAARLTGCGERSVGRWAADPSFRRRVDAIRGELTRRAAGRLALGMTKAAGVLIRLLSSRSESIKLGAARSLLVGGVQVGEAADLAARIAALEERYAKFGNPRRVVGANGTG